MQPMPDVPFTLPFGAPPEQLAAFAVLANGGPAGVTVQPGG